MDQELYDQLLTIMVAAELPEDSSAELAFHVALHYPEHGLALLAEAARKAPSPEPDDTSPSGEEVPPGPEGA